jgi:hypothetical protein
MRYIDSGHRDPAQVLGTWFESVMLPDIAELRWQTGYFTSDSLGFLVETLVRFRTEGKRARVVVGSNDPGTLGDDVRVLAELLGLPRANAELGVVGYEAGFFHPKTYHFRREDGSQCACVGSANLTLAGVGGLHVEACVLLDSRDGDSTAILDEIAEAVDVWFTAPPREGFERVVNAEDVARLISLGALAATRPPRQPRVPRTGAEAEDGNELPERAHLKPLVKVPAVPRLAAGLAESVEQPPVLAPEPPVAVPAPAALVSAPRPDFPAYLLFAPGATTPTVGADALTGANLPGDAVGLVIRLNRDSARHFGETPGTANISIPVATTGTFRFGIYSGKYDRPRGEFGLRVRYLSEAFNVIPPLLESSIMAYGFAPGETGHGDLRMLVPGGVKTLRDQLAGNGIQLPAVGDVALLEWPTAANPIFSLTFMDQASPVGQQARQLFVNAENGNQLVGNGACWLVGNVSPTW